jgi:D-alanine-D-alanine ligase
VLLVLSRLPVLGVDSRRGREFRVGTLVRGARAGALATLEVMLLDGADAGVYSYRNKTQWQGLVDYGLLGAGPLRTEVEAVAVAAWRCLGCRDAGRVDVRLDDAGRPQLLEVNPLAGLAPGYSDLPIMAERSGMSYTSLIAEILRSTMTRIDAG